MALKKKPLKPKKTVKKTPKKPKSKKKPFLGEIGEFIRGETRYKDFPLYK